MTAAANLPLPRRQPRLSVADAFSASLRGEPCRVIGSDHLYSLPTWRWRGEPDDGDEQLLQRCQGATVDIGCGPGRMTKALLHRGVAALGIDVVAEAVEQTRARGGVALHRDVFSRLPGEGRWDTALLADGNIGIGGDPVRLLTRAAELLRPNGRVVVDLAAPGGPVRVQRLRLEMCGRHTPSFWWAVVPADQVELLAEAAALKVLHVHHHHGRWFAELETKGPS